MLNRSKRGTGRTTRMMEHAIELIKQGRTVYVMVCNHHYTRMLDFQYREYGIKFVTPSTLPNFDWDGMRLIGAHPNCDVLIDHSVTEQRFSAQIEMMHRYDTPDGELDQHWLT